MKVKVKLLSSVQLSATPWTVAHQAPPSMGLSRQEYWSGVPLPSPTSFYTWTLFPGPALGWGDGGEDFTASILHMKKLRFREDDWFQVTQ